MSPALSILIALGLGLIAWLVARSRAYKFRRAAPEYRSSSLPQHFGWYAAIWVVLPILVFLAVWTPISADLVLSDVLASPAAESLPAFGQQRQAILAEASQLAHDAGAQSFYPQARELAEVFASSQNFYTMVGVALALAIGAIASFLVFSRIKPDLQARSRVEKLIMAALLLFSLVAILTTLGIFITLVFETVRFFGMVSPVDFLFGIQWNPDPMSSAENPDGSRYGAIPLFWGTLFIGAIIAMIVAIPLGMMSAIYLTQYANPKLRTWLKPALEILAGVPTVVYGYFAALTIAPAIRDVALSLGVSNPSSESALAAGLVMGVMIIPFVSSMADDSIAAVPSAMRDGSLAMGATTNETIQKVLVPAALPGIVAGIMLAVSRAIGETMIVVMAASTAANLTGNPLEAMTTVTVQIVALLTGEGSFDHPATLAAFALGFVLFMVTLALNFIALRVVKKFREAYD